MCVLLKLLGPVAPALSALVPINLVASMVKFMPGATRTKRTDRAFHSAFWLVATSLVLFQPHREQAIEVGIRHSSCM